MNYKYSTLNLITTGYYTKSTPTNYNMIGYFPLEETGKAVMTSPSYYFTVEHNFQNWHTNATVTYSSVIASFL